MTADQEQMHVLIIEDELLIGLGLQAQLYELGYRSFAFAGTARQALEQALLQSPDLVTVDVGLLDGDGLAAVDAVLDACGPLPVIYVTGDAGAVRARPPETVVEKPVSSGALARAVSAARATPRRPEPDRPSSDRHEQWLSS